MRGLLDTHAFLWWLAGDSSLSAAPRDLIFDRMLIAQAILEDCALISNDAVFDRYVVTRLW